MRITKNTSPFENKTLRSIICKVHAHMRKLERKPAPNWKNLRVHVRGRTARGGWSGHSYYDGNGRAYGSDWDVVFTLGPDMTIGGFAIAVYHELMHTYGYRHRHYNDMPYREATELFPDTHADRLTRNEPLRMAA